MFEENEVVMLILGIGVLIFILLNLNRIKRIYAWKLLVPGYCFLLAGWFLTVLEGFFAGSLFNFLEHACYTCSSIIVAFWCLRSVFRSPKEVT
ncbi:MAG TPA: hypothetical protein VJ203_03215 [Bacteroidales bacterium]|nr:hypothetical protein [Bacteroidales bacterium]